MRSKWMAVLVFMLLVVPVVAQEPAATQPPQNSLLKTQQDKVSYGIGASVAKQLQRDMIEISIDVFMQGFKDTLAGSKLLMTDEEIQKTLKAFSDELMQKQMQARQKLSDENKKAGDAFLAENKKKEGVITLPSGLQYKVITMGNGKKPTLTDTVECNYRGTLIDGTEFDSSYKRGQPATFQVSGIIPGWKEALQIMPVGSKWQLFIPADLAYGSRDQGPGGPNSMLIFDLELLAVK